jgi:hypothetical protein
MSRQHVGLCGLGRTEILGLAQLGSPAGPRGHHGSWLARSGIHSPERASDRESRLALVRNGGVVGNNMSQVGSYGSHGGVVDGEGWCGAVGSGGNASSRTAARCSFSCSVSSVGSFRCPTWMKKGCGCPGRGCWRRW